MLSLLLKIAVAWFFVSLLYVSVWALLTEFALRRKARHVPTPGGTSTQSLSEKEVDALLAAPAASDPPGTQERTSQPARAVRLAR